MKKSRYNLSIQRKQLIMTGYLSNDGFTKILSVFLICKYENTPEHIGIMLIDLDLKVYRNAANILSTRYRASNLAGMRKTICLSREHFEKLLVERGASMKTMTTLQRLVDDQVISTVLRQTIEGCVGALVRKIWVSKRLLLKDIGWQS